MYNNELTNIPLDSKKDFEKAFLKLYDPLRMYIDNKSSFVYLPNYTATTYSNKKLGIESFARILWGLGPYLSQVDDEITINMVGNKIINGVSPQSEYYWGDLENYDQISVEMPPIALFLYFTKDKFWDNLDCKNKINIKNWFSQINLKKVSNNNWLFFRIIVNMVLNKLGVGTNEELDKTFNEIETFYIGNGWYSDGKTDQIDYYISFAIHYYSLIYAKIMEQDDIERSKLLKERAEVFAEQFIYWFSEEGSAVPFGRSLTYRFAQVAFWSTYQFAGLKGIPVGTVKGIITRHLSWWFNQPIFDASNLLTVGYSYPNLIMSEDYNGTGSAYWALKTFIILSLDENNEFWLCNALPMPKLNSIRYFKECKMTICRNSHNVLAFVNGQSSGSSFPNIEAKYEKHVYSTLFGFSVPRSNIGLRNYAQDSTLSVSNDGEYFKAKHKVFGVRNNESYMYSIWIPWKGTEIESYIFPGIPWHVRVYIIKTDKYIELQDSGFCVEKGDNLNSIIYNENGICVKNENIYSGIVSLIGNGNPELIEPAPNTNLLYTKTILPFLKWKLQKGKYIVANAIIGDLDEKRNSENIWCDMPVVNYNNYQISINMNGSEVKVNLERKYKIPINIYKQTVDLKQNITNAIAKFKYIK